MSAELIVVTWLGDAGGSLELAAVLAVAAAREGEGLSGVLLIELGDRAPSRPTILASEPARELEQALGEVCGKRAVARGRTCQVRLPSGREGLDLAAAALAALPGAPLCILHAAPELLRPLLDRPGLRPAGAVLRVDLDLDRPLAALIAADLCAGGFRVRISKRPTGWLEGRLALAGLPPGEAAERPARRLLSGLRERRQASRRSLGMIVEC